MSELPIGRIEQLTKEVSALRADRIAHGVTTYSEKQLAARAADLADEIGRQHDESIRRAEREACAALVEAAGCSCGSIPETAKREGDAVVKLGKSYHWIDCSKALAAAIRARGGEA